MTRRIASSLAGILLVFGSFAGLFMTTPAQAGVTPLAVSIVPPVQFPPSDFTIAGARVSVLWGEHRDVYGFDIGGLGNITDLGFVGVGASGLFNITHGSTTILGLQAAGLFNANTEKTTVVGVQVAAFNSNTAESSLIGVGVGPIANYSPFMNIYGLQVGLYNKALNVYGFQIGLVNSADSLHGIQIGLINFNRTGMFSVAPI